MCAIIYLRKALIYEKEIVNVKLSWYMCAIIYLRKALIYEKEIVNVKLSFLKNGILNFAFCKSVP